MITTVLLHLLSKPLLWLCQTRAGHYNLLHERSELNLSRADRGGGREKGCDPNKFEFKDTLAHLCDLVLKRPLFRLRPCPAHSTAIAVNRAGGEAAGSS